MYIILIFYIAFFYNIFQGLQLSVITPKTISHGNRRKNVKFHKNCEKTGKILGTSNFINIMSQVLDLNFKIQRFLFFSFFSFFRIDVLQKSFDKRSLTINVLSCPPAQPSKTMIGSIGNSRKMKIFSFMTRLLHNKTFYGVWFFHIACHSARNRNIT